MRWPDRSFDPWVFHAWRGGRRHSAMPPALVLACSWGSGLIPNEAAIRRLVGALLLEQNDEYATQKLYVSLDSRQSLTANPAISLPAAPALVN